MTELLIRSTDFEVTGDGRNLEGIAIAYDRPSQVTDDGVKRYWEEFDPKAAAQTIRMRGLRALFVEHEHLRGSVGETSFEDSAEGLIFRARMTDSRYASTTLGRINDGELTDVSLGFRSLRHLTRSDPTKGPVTRRTEVAIEELSLARVGQHDGTKILSVRSEGTPRLDALRRRKLLLGTW